MQHKTTVTSISNGDTIEHLPMKKILSTMDDETVEIKKLLNN